MCNETERFHLGAPSIGWTCVRPLPNNPITFSASYLTNPWQEITKALLNLLYTREKQSVTLDAEGTFVTVVYSKDCATVYDMDDSIIAQEPLSCRDIDKMLIRICMDVAQDAEKWLNEWDSDYDDEETQSNEPFDTFCNHRLNLRKELYERDK